MLSVTRTGSLIQLGSSLLLATLLLISGCTSLPASVQSVPQTADLILCEEPRTQICTREYRPVCAQLETGSSKTYSNGCTSCSDPQVVSYIADACAE